MENNELDGQLNIARFLEQFNQGPRASANATNWSETPSVTGSIKNIQNNHAFEKLEEKIQELEEKFAASSAQSQAVLQELARTREAVEAQNANQKNKDAFIASLAASIANLKKSVENLSRVQNKPALYNPAPTPARAFDAPTAPANEYLSMSYYQPDNYRAAQQAKLRAAYDEKNAALSELHTERLEKEKVQANLIAERTEKEQILASLTQERQAKEQAELSLQDQHKEHEEEVKQLQSEKDLAWAGWNAALEEKDKIVSSLEQERSAWDQERAAKMIELDVARSGVSEKNRIIASLQQKTSQLKAVNVAMDREIKRVQEERTEALRKSAEQAKEILSLRDALTAAEERFKSFDFEGRIISVKRQYEQKVTHLESQLQEVSATCMKQVEEIESLKAENIHLHKLAEEREQLSALYDVKTRELESLKKVIEKMRNESSAQQMNRARLAALTQRMNHLKMEHSALSAQLVQTKDVLKNVTVEKQTLEKNFQALRKRIEENDSVIAALKDQIAVLTRENHELKNRVPAPSANETPREPVVAHVVAKPIKKQIHAKAQAAIEPPQSTSPQTAVPVQLQDTVQTAIKTDNDLPEIRVADPLPQDEVYNGEDFLERTDSFIGRMKWSIFREDK